MNKLLMLIGLIVLAAGPAFTLDLYVAPGGSNIPPFTNWAMAATNINAAVDLANMNNAGDIVWISNGTYVLTATVFVTNTIVRGFSTNNADAIVDGAGAYTCFKLAHANAVVDGLTITNGNATGNSPMLYYGGGAYLQDGTLRNCLLINNKAHTRPDEPGYGGGGAYMKNPGNLISNCIFRGNWSIVGAAHSYYPTQGGGIYMVDGLVVNCQFYNNLATNGSGGGIYMLAGAISNCYFFANLAGSYGGGVYALTGTVANCQIISNRIGVFDVLTGPGGGGACLDSASALLLNSTIASNDAKYGAGVLLQNGATASNCVIRGNFSGASEAQGMGVSLGKNTTLVNCLVMDNAGSGWYQYGAGIFVGAYNVSTTCVINCTVVSNGLYGTQPFGIPGLNLSAPPAWAGVFTGAYQVVNCIILSNKTDWAAVGYNCFL